MAVTTGTRLVRALAPVILAAAVAVGAGVLSGGEHAAAQSIPNKTCTGSGPGGVAEPGDTISCVVMAAGALVSGDAITVEPLTPVGADIPLNGCTGVTGLGTAPFTYNTTVTESGGACTWTVTATTFGTVGNSVLGTETLKIPSATANGTSVTQQAKQCGPALPGIGVLCSPLLPMGTSGAGSCVGGMAVPVVGGCVPSLPTPTPTPKPTATPKPTSSATDTPGPTDPGTGSPTPGGVQGVSTTTPFTSGPNHPLPVAAALVITGGVLLALLAAFGPRLLHRRRRLP